jgi:hypothetical protein
MTFSFIASPLTILLLQFIFSNQLQCQITISTDIGYQFPWATDDIPDGNINVYPNGIKEVEIENISLGSGAMYSISLNYPLSSWLESFFTFSYQDGKKYSQVFKSSLSGVNNITNYQGSMIWFTPGVGLNLKSKRTVFFSKLGLSLGINGKISSIQKISSSNSNSDIEILYSEGMAYGIYSGLGGKVNISKNNRWSLTSEIRLISASFAPKKGNLVKYDINNQDILPSLSVNEKQVIYKNKYIEDDSVPVDPNEPTVSARRFYPYSSIGINVGVLYTFY